MLGHVCLCGMCCVCTDHSFPVGACIFLDVLVFCLLSTYILQRSAKMLKGYVVPFLAFSERCNFSSSQWRRDQD